MELQYMTFGIGQFREDISVNSPDTCCRAGAMRPAGQIIEAIEVANSTDWAQVITLLFGVVGLWKICGHLMMKNWFRQFMIPKFP